jgi:cytochrome bd-type quinol oxidase subunit 2
LTSRGLGPLLQSERRSRRRRPFVSWALRVAAALVVFALGVALGQALEETPEPGRTRTSVRTLVPETLPARTVTVTVPIP